METKTNYYFDAYLKTLGVLQLLAEVQEQSSDNDPDLDTVIDELDIVLTSLGNKIGDHPVVKRAAILGGARGC